MDLSFLRRHQFKTLIDVGANDGSYGSFLRKFFDIPRAIAFEPLPAHREALIEKGFETHQLALDNVAREARFIVNRYDAASSLHALTPTTAREWPEAAETAEIRVQTARLDDLDLGELPNLLIKVDAQGAEAEIIEGGRKTFALAKTVLIEVCFVPLYEHQGLFEEIHAPLAEMGFRLSGFKHQHVGKDGRPLFAHCVYENNH